MSDTKSVELLGKILKQLQTNSIDNPSLGIDTGGLNSKTINQLTQAISTMSNAASNTQNAAEQAVGTIEHAAATMNTLGPVFGTTVLSMQQLERASGGLGKKIAKMTGLSKVFKAAKGPVLEITKSFSQLSKTFKENETGLKKMYAVLSTMTAVTGAIAGAFVSIGTSIVKIGISLAKSVMGALTSVFSMITKISTFVVTLPIELANKAAGLGNQLRQEIVEVIGQAVENTKQFMDTATNGGQAMVNLGRIAKGSLLSFQSVNSTMTKLFGYGATGAANMINELSKGINDMGVFADVFATSTTKSGKSIEFFTRMTRGMGMSADDVKYVMLEAMTNGEHYFNVMTRFKEASDTVSAEFGVNRKRLSGNFLQLRKDIVSFGHLSDIELHRVAATATQLGVEMKDVSGVFNKFGTFEDAANSAALLSQTFGMNIDALQLIKAEDPMEIVKMFRSAMQATGRSFNDLNRHEKALMAQYTGMSAEALKSIMNYRNAGKSFEDIKKIMKDQRPEERQIRAMKDMNTQMSEIQKIMDKKDFFTAFFDGVSKTIMYQGKMGGVLKQISKNMENFYESGLRFDKKGRNQLDNILAPFTNILSGINNLFKPASLRGLKKQMLSGLESLMNEIQNPKSLAAITSTTYQTNPNSLQAKIYNMFTLKGMMSNSGFIGDLAKQTGQLVKLMMQSFITAGPEIARGLGDAVLAALSFLRYGEVSKEGNEAFASFLGMKSGSPAFIKLKSQFAARMNELKEYMFGTGGDYRTGFVYRLIHGVSSTTKDVAKQLKEELGEGGSVFGDMFKSIGKSIISGMSEAKEALIAVGESIAFGVGRAFGLEMDPGKSGISGSNEYGKGSGANRVVQQYRRGGVISGTSAAIEEVNHKVDDLLAAKSSDSDTMAVLKFLTRGGKMIPDFVLGTLPSMSESGFGFTQMAKAKSGSNYHQDSLKNFKSFIEANKDEYFGSAMPGALSTLTGPSLSNLGAITNKRLFSTGPRGPGGFRPLSTPTRRFAQRGAGFLKNLGGAGSPGQGLMRRGLGFVARRVPVLTILAEVSNYKMNVNQAAQMIKGLKQAGLVLSKSDEEEIMSAARKSEVLRRGGEMAGGLLLAGKGAAAGASFGATAGSFLGPAGTVIGGGLGMLAGGALGYFAGSSLGAAAMEMLGVNTAQGEVAEQLEQRQLVDKLNFSGGSLYDVSTGALPSDMNANDARRLTQLAARAGGPTAIGSDDLDALQTDRLSAQRANDFETLAKLDATLQTLKDYLYDLEQSPPTSVSLEIDSTTLATIMVDKLGQMKDNPAMGAAQYTIQTGPNRSKF